MIKINVHFGLTQCCRKFHEQQGKFSLLFLLLFIGLGSTAFASNLLGDNEENADVVTYSMDDKAFTVAASSIFDLEQTCGGGAGISRGFYAACLIDG